MHFMYSSIFFVGSFLKSDASYAPHTVAIGHRSLQGSSTLRASAHSSPILFGVRPMFGSLNDCVTAALSDF